MGNSKSPSGLFDRFVDIVSIAILMLASAAVAYGVWAAYQVDERYLWVGAVVGVAIGAMTSPFWWPKEPDVVIERVPEVAR